VSAGVALSTGLTVAVSVAVSVVVLVGAGVLVATFGAYALTAVSRDGVLRRAAVTGCFRRGVTVFDLADRAWLVGCSVLDDAVVEVSRARLVSGSVRSGAGALEPVVLTRCSR
jgi:hypothetical protein